MKNQSEIIYFQIDPNFELFFSYMNFFEKKWDLKIHLQKQKQVIYILSVSS